MQPTVPAEGFIVEGRRLRATQAGVLSAIDVHDEGASYDRHAAIYDRLLRSRAYNRLIWGTAPSDYAAFASEALAAGSGLFLDAGCGTTVSTAEHYQASERPLVLVDRSLGMLQRARERLGESATLIQADMLDLPFARCSFETVGCFGVLHVLDNPWAALRSLREQLQPNGELYASMLVTDHGRLSKPYLSALRRRGEVGPLRTVAELTATAREIFGDSARISRTGAMAWLRASV